MSQEITIRTTDSGWLLRVAEAYREKQTVIIVDDADVGFDPRTESLLDMGRRAQLERKDWMGVLISLGMSGAGLWMVLAAVVDPEPTSKLGLLVLGGSVLVFSGGFSAIRILTNTHPPTVEVTPQGIRLSW